MPDRETTPAARWLLFELVDVAALARAIEDRA